MKKIKERGREREREREPEGYLGKRELQYATKYCEPPKPRISGETFHYIPIWKNYEQARKRFLFSFSYGY